MNNQDMWAWYTPSPWNGEPLLNGSYIAFRANKYMDQLDNFSDVHGWVTTMQWQYNPENPQLDYLTVPESGGDTGGSVFRVTTCPQPDGPFPDGPSRYQLITLQGASGKYLAPGSGGDSIVAEATQDDAFIFCLDLTLGNQTVLWHIFYPYRLKDDITYDALTRVWENGEYQESFGMLAGFDPGEGPILLNVTQGDSAAGILDVFVMPIRNGMRVKDLNDGAYYLVLDGTLHLIPFPHWIDGNFLFTQPGQSDSKYLERKRNCHIW